MKIFQLYISLMFIVLLFLPGTNLYSQENSQDKAEAKVERNLPVLGGHNFVVNTYTRSPFIKTYLRNSLGAGQAVGLEIPIYEIEGSDVVGLRGDLFFASLDFEYQYAVNNWLAVWAQFGIVSRLGSSAQSLLAQGINATVEFELGWLLKIYESDKVLLSGTINLWNKSGTVVNIYDFVQNIIDEGEVTPDNQLVINRNFIQGGGGFRFAWAASRLIGVNLLTELAYGESVDKREENDLFYNFAASADLDLNDNYNVPIGFALGVKLNSFATGSDNTVKNQTSTFFLRTAYTSESNFLVSLDMSWLQIPQVQTDNTLNASIIGLNLEFYF